MEAEDILEERIVECIEQVKEFSEQRKVIVQKIQNALNNSKLNVSGVTDQESQLTFTPLHGQNLPSEFLLEISIGSRKASFPRCPGPSPSWNISLSLPVADPKQHLKV
jgi:hypothetical protein